ncbi:MAG: hypothetical protein SFX73_03095 [Kofleriaceae bacterium]|nr:hypothetical protein [Kofleriaceae bacterium]
MSEESLLAEVERELDDLDRLNKANKVSLAPHADALAALKDHIEAQFEDLRDDFVSETEEMEASDFVEALQGLFENDLEDVAEAIEDECPDAADDDALAAKLHSELMRHIARLVLA